VALVELWLIGLFLLATEVVQEVLVAFLLHQQLHLSSIRYKDISAEQDRLLGNGVVEVAALPKLVKLVLVEPEELLA
jgi:hypothetical protein